MENIGKQIRIRRLDAHLTQQQLADKLNVTNKTISKWETNRTLPDIEMITAMSKIFNITVDELLTGKKELRLKTKKLLTVTFIEMIIFIIISSIIYHIQSIDIYNFILTLLLPNILTLLLASAISYFISIQSKIIKILKYIIYFAYISYDTIFLFSILSSVGIFISPIRPMIIYPLIILFSIIIGI
jgi:transcriptional regulator with XRE-family HTH domain